MSHSPDRAACLHRMSHQPSIHNRSRPTRPSSKSLVKSNVASIAANGWIGEDATISEIFNRGVIDCGINASKILDYTSGTASGYLLNIDHIISVVGCDNDATEREYWILRNSWREFW